jgi:hypothetical protein
MDGLGLDIDEVWNLCDAILKEDEVLRGITNVEVKSIIRHRETEDGGLTRDSKEFAVETTGANIADILLVDEIDKNTMISTSIRDTYRVYGIEAARQKLINEIIRFMEDNVPNERHIKIYADYQNLKK